MATRYYYIVFDKQDHYELPLGVFDNARETAEYLGLTERVIHVKFWEKFSGQEKYEKYHKDEHDNVVYTNNYGIERIPKHLVDTVV
jgi:hypothetical protein